MNANNLRPPVKDRHLLLATNSLVMGVRLSIKRRLGDQTDCTVQQRRSTEIRLA